MILSNDNKYRGNLGSTLKLDEYSHVEKPFLEQLTGLGWDVLELQMQQEPGQSFRTSFSEVVLKLKLKEALVKINPFLTTAQIDELERKITTFQKNSLLENNQQVLHWILRFDLCHPFRSNSATCFGSNCAIFLSRISVRFVPLSG